MRLRRTLLVDTDQYDSVTESLIDDHGCTAPYHAAAHSATSSSLSMARASTRRLLLSTMPLALSCGASHEVARSRRDSLVERDMPLSLSSRRPSLLPSASTSSSRKRTLLCSQSSDASAYSPLPSSFFPSQLSQHSVLPFDEDLQDGQISSSTHGDGISESQERDNDSQQRPRRRTALHSQSIMRQIIHAESQPSPLPRMLCNAASQSVCHSTLAW